MILASALKCCLVTLAAVVAGSAGAAEPAPQAPPVKVVTTDSPRSGQVVLEDWEVEVMAQMELLENLDLLEKLDLLEDLPVLRGEGGGS